MGLTEDFRNDIRFWENIRTLDLIAAIIRDSSGPVWDNTMAIVQERHPELTPYEKQRLAKMIIVEANPRGGPELRRWFEEALRQSRGAR